MPEPWPRCATKARIFDKEMTCCLPKGHLLDGEQMHEDEESSSLWVFTITYPDGHEERR